MYKFKGLFTHVKSWVNCNTLLNAEEVYHGTLRVKGSTKESYIKVDIQYAGVEYLCKGYISYWNPHKGEFQDLINISKTVRTEGEIIKLVNDSVITANKLSRNIKSLEQEINI